MVNVQPDTWESGKDFNKQFSPAASKNPKTSSYQSAVYIEILENFNWYERCAKKDPLLFKKGHQIKMTMSQST